MGCGKDSDDDPVSRDAYVGTMMGLAFAYELVPPVQSQVRQMVDTALDYVITQNNWNIPAPPDGRIFTTLIGEFDTQVDFLRIGATVDPQMWLQKYQKYQDASALAWIPIWLSTFDPFNNYFGFNLSHASFSPVLFLEQSNPPVRQNSQHCQILSAFALPVESRPGDRDYIWEDSPFDTGVTCPDYSTSVGPAPCDGQIGPLPCDNPIVSTPDREGAAIGYLLAYWLSVYMELLK